MDAAASPGASARVREAAVTEERDRLARRVHELTTMLVEALTQRDMDEGRWASLHEQSRRQIEALQRRVCECQCERPNAHGAADPEAHWQLPRHDGEQDPEGGMPRPDRPPQLRLPRSTALAAAGTAGGTATMTSTTCGPPDHKAAIMAPTDIFDNDVSGLPTAKTVQTKQFVTLFTGHSAGGGGDRESDHLDRPTHDSFERVTSGPPSRPTVRLAPAMEAARARFGTQPTHLQGRAVCVQPLLATGDIQNGTLLSGNIAVIMRGELSFVEKVRKVQKLGAIGVIFINHTTNPFVPSCNALDPSDDPIVIPSVCVGREDGQAFLLAKSPIDVLWIEHHGSASFIEAKAKRLHSGTFSLNANMEKKDKRRVQASEIDFIMRAHEVDFDQARLLYVQRKLLTNGIDLDTGVLANVNSHAVESTDIKIRHIEAARMAAVKRAEKAEDALVALQWSAEHRDTDIHEVLRHLSDFKTT